MGAESKPALRSSSKFLLGGRHDVSWKPYSPLVWAYAWPRWQGSGSFIGYIQANGYKITVGLFQNLRAMVATRTQVDAISAESFQKHVGNMTLVIAFVKLFFGKGAFMRSNELREAICLEVVKILKDERQRRKLSMIRLAEQSGLSQSTISLIERDLRNPTLDSLLRITEVLEIELSAVLVKAKQTVARRVSKG